MYEGLFEGLAGSESMDLIYVGWSSMVKFMG